MEFCRQCQGLKGCVGDVWAAQIESQVRYMTGETPVGGNVKLLPHSLLALINGCEAKYITNCDAVGVDKTRLKNAIAEAREFFYEIPRADGGFE